MRCPSCGGCEDRVLESRHSKTGATTRRRRECASCGYRFTSYEKIEEKPLMVVKRDGRRELFDPVKLSKGLRISLQKRPVGEETIEEILLGVEDDAVQQSLSTQEIPAERLGELVLKRLYSVDPVGYVRFASVYRRFENVDQFINEIENFRAQGEE